MPVAGITLDYVFSEDPQLIDRGLRETMRGIHFSILVMAVGLTRMREEKLYLKLGYKKFSAYLHSFAEEKKRSENQLYEWIKIGEVFFRYRQDLEAIGFDGTQGSSKLPFLEKALQKAPKEEVLSKLMTLSVRDFAAFAKPVKEGPPQPRQAPGFKRVGNTFYIGEREVLTMASDLTLDEEDMIRSAVRAALRALQRRGKFLVVHLRNSRERKEFRAEAIRIRREIRQRLKKEKERKLKKRGGNPAGP